MKNISFLFVFLFALQLPLVSSYGVGSCAMNGGGDFEEALLKDQEFSRSKDYQTHLHGCPLVEACSDDKGYFRRSFTHLALSLSSLWALAIINPIRYAIYPDPKTFSNFYNPYELSLYEASFNEYENLETLTSYCFPGQKVITCAMPSDHDAYFVAREVSVIALGIFGVSNFYCASRYAALGVFQALDVPNCALFKSLYKKFDQWTKDYPSLPFITNCLSDVGYIAIYGYLSYKWMPSYRYFTWLNPTEENYASGLCQIFPMNNEIYNPVNYLQNPYIVFVGDKLKQYVNYTDFFGCLTSASSHLANNGEFSWPVLSAYTFIGAGWNLLALTRRVMRAAKDKIQNYWKRPSHKVLEY